MSHKYDVCLCCHQRKKMVSKNHIISRFVIQRMKKKGNGLHGFKNNGNQIPIQDNYAEYVFCSDCEQLFNSQAEAKTGKIKNYNQLTLSEIQTLNRFTLVHCFRVGVALTNQSKANPLIDDLTLNAIDHWRKCVLSYSKPNKDYEIYWLPTSDVVSRNAGILIDPVQHYLDNNIFYDFYECKKARFLVISIPNLYMIGFIKRPTVGSLAKKPTKNSWKNLFSKVVFERSKKFS